MCNLAQVRKNHIIFDVLFYFEIKLDIITEITL